MVSTRAGASRPLVVVGKGSWGDAANSQQRFYQRVQLLLQHWCRLVQHGTGCTRACAAASVCAGTANCSNERACTRRISEKERHWVSAQRFCGNVHGAWWMDIRTKLGWVDGRGWKSKGAPTHGWIKKVDGWIWTGFGRSWMDMDKNVSNFSENSDQKRCQNRQKPRNFALK